MDAIIKDALQAARRLEFSEPVMACATQIMHHIHSGQLKPAQRLGETSLAKQLGFGRAQVRSALDHLAYAGILDRRARSGTYLRRLSLTQYVERVGYRGCLEGFAVREACFRLTKPQLDRLKRQARELDAAGRSESIPIDQLRDRDVAFHMAVCKASGNAFVGAELSSQRFLLHCLADSRLLNLPMLGYRNADIPHHTEIVEALRQRDPNLAERIMRRHIFASTYCSLKHYMETEEAAVGKDKAIVRTATKMLARICTWLDSAVSDKWPVPPYEV